jgi:7 transmembrane sweet-taste receptor of 3 GCPR/Receptor family ligand binding region
LTKQESKSKETMFMGADDDDDNVDGDVDGDVVIEPPPKESVLGSLPDLDALLYAIHTQAPSNVTRRKGSVVDEVDITGLVLDGNMSTSQLSLPYIETTEVPISTSVPINTTIWQTTQVGGGNKTKTTRSWPTSSFASINNETLWEFTVGKDDDVEPILFSHCHIVGMNSFTPEHTLSVYEDTAAIVLALQHLNTGDGSVIPALEGLPERCPIRFSIEFIDTQANPGLAVDDVFDIASRSPPDEVITTTAGNNANQDVDTTSRQDDESQTNTETNRTAATTTSDIKKKALAEFSTLLPCAFLGAERSSVSLPTSLLTGHRGYVQVSSTSSATSLDDKLQYPLFGRTTPSDKHDARRIFRYFRDVIGIRYLAMLNVDDAYGNSFGQAFQVAVEEWNLEQATVGSNDKFRFHRVSFSSDLTDIDGSLERVKESKYRYVLAAVLAENNIKVLERAAEKGIAGDGMYQWFFPASFASHLEGMTFEKGSKMHLAIRGVGTFSPGSAYTDHLAVNSDDDDDHSELPINAAFLEQMAAINNPTDMKYLNSVLPKAQQTRQGPSSRRRLQNGKLSSIGPGNQIAPVSSGAGFGDRLSGTFIDRFQKPENSTLSSVPFLNDQSFLRPVRYDRAAFAYDAAVLVGLSACEAFQEGSLTGSSHFQHLKMQDFLGVTGNVLLDPQTASRLPNSTYLKLFNFIEEELEERQTKNKTTTIIRFNRVLTDLFYNSTWHPVTPYTYSNNSTLYPPSDLPPPNDSVSQISPPVRVISLTFFSIIFAIAVVCILWTFRNRKIRVVRASQPEFLFLICIGVIVLASAIVPMTFDMTVATLEANSKACTSVVWLVALGVCIIFSSLFTKTWRINKIMSNAKQFRRVKVTITDLIWPMVGLMVANVSILTAMTGTLYFQILCIVMPFWNFVRPLFLTNFL